jgi:pyruvate dehydrogenase E1 component
MAVLAQQDTDSLETNEWLEALESVIEEEGIERAQFILQQLGNYAASCGIKSASNQTPYRNTISLAAQPKYPGDIAMERRIRSIVRWNAMAMVVRGNKNSPGIGGHISSFASCANLYEIGFNHFFHAPTPNHGGDLIFYQGHTSPGIYARSFLEGRLTEENLDNFRHEVNNPKGLSSYPHPWLMEDYWQFPTVSMGLGPMQAIYQAYFLRYLANRQLLDTQGRNVWAFVGDGEMDEPESIASLSFAGREKLDNLTFVVNCNLQRLDGPVRGNGKIIQELERLYTGAGWNVIKLVWGHSWDALLDKDVHGILQQRMDEAVDGEYQSYKNLGGDYTRKEFFNKYPELAALVADLSDEQIYRLDRGGHDSIKVYAAYAAAMEHTGQPTVILAKTVKGYGTGKSGEANNITHSIKSLSLEDLKNFRDRFHIPVPDDHLDEFPYYKPEADSPEMHYLQAQREKLGGFLPQRRTQFKQLAVPGLDAFATQLKGTDRENSTTMVFVRILSALVKDKQIGKYVVPIVPDEARTFGMEGMFRQIGIYTAEGQKYKPHDANQVMFYREDQKGQILEEGINEAGAFSAWLAAATSISNNDLPMVPFYTFYSMFGFQRIGDLAWAAGDLHARGFLMGATAGRTSLAGEGLQHLDGHSHLLASTIPNCLSYDPCYAYELAVIIQNGLERMYLNHEKIYYYITLMNENYTHPPIVDGCEDGILKGMYLLRKSENIENAQLKVHLFGSGTILREAEQAAQILQDKYNVSSYIWSITSYNQLYRDAMDARRFNMLNPEQEAKQSYVAAQLEIDNCPVIAASDYVKNYSGQIAAFIAQDYTVLGTDGFGRSDDRANLRDFFEVDAKYITIAALESLVNQGSIAKNVLVQALQELKIDTSKPNPLYL